MIRVLKRAVSLAALYLASFPALGFESAHRGGRSSRISVLQKRREALGSRAPTGQALGAAHDPAEPITTNRKKFLRAVGSGAAAAAAALLAEAGPGAARPVVSSRDLKAQEDAIISLFDRSSPSVAYISTFLELSEPLTRNPVDVPLGTGSGIVWDKEGHVVTNFHLIRNSESAQITLLEDHGTARRTFSASLVGYDADKDVAVLKVDGVPSEETRRLLVPVALGTSKGLRVGQTVLAIGNPFGLDHSLSTGIVSGVGREVTSPSGRPITDAIQTDAAVNPGNSGGVLLDSSGRLVGMNTAIYSKSGASTYVALSTRDIFTTFLVCLTILIVAFIFPAKEALGSPFPSTPSRPRWQPSSPRAVPS